MGMKHSSDHAEQGFKRTLKRFLSSFLAVLTFESAVALPLSYAMAANPAAPPTAAESLDLNHRASLRLTHILFSAVLDRYAKDGLEKYRPDFLLNDRYIRTFLYEWGVALEKGDADSTLQIWQRLSKKNSFLGGYYRVWDRVVPHAFADTKDAINLGFMRQVYLASVLRSETTADFNARSREVMELTSKYLLNQEEDRELGVKIISAYSSHMDAKLREDSTTLLQNFPAFAKTVEFLGFVRNLALGFATGKAVTGGLAGAVAKRAVTKAKAVADAASKAQLRLRNVIRTPELVSSIRISRLTKSFIAAGAVHVAAGAAMISNAEKSKAEAKRKEEAEAERKSILAEAFANQESPMAFLTTVALNTASERPSYILEQRDFELPARPRVSLEKSQWMARGESALNSWNASNKASEGFSFHNFILDAERFLGHWPKDEALARIEMQSRYARLKQRLDAAELWDIEDLRREILENELSNYRGERRTLTSVLLDWGGNCVSQTLTLVSALLEFPDMVPSDKQLGVYLSPTHMEAVLLSQDEVYFLVSGEKRPRDESLTVLKPQALVAMALASVNPKFVLQSEKYYLNGRPADTPDKSGGMRAGGGLSFLSQLSSLLGTKTEFGIVKGAADFKSRGDGRDAASPDSARVAYNVPHKMSGSGIGALSDASGATQDSPPIQYTEISRVPTPQGIVEMCVQLKDEVVTKTCRFSKAPSQLNRIATQEALGLFLSSDSAGKLYLEVITTKERKQTLNSTPAELKLLQINRWQMDLVATHLLLEKMDSQLVSRAQSLELQTGDSDYLMDGGVSLRAKILADNGVQSNIRTSASLFEKLIGTKWRGPSQRVAGNMFSKKVGFADATMYKTLEISRPEIDRSATSSFSTFLTMSGYYFSSLQQKYKNQPEVGALIYNRSLDAVTSMENFNWEMREQLTRSSGRFITAFKTYDFETKMALVDWARQPGQRSMVGALRQFLNKLGPKQLIVEAERPLVKPQTAGLKVQIQTAVCTLGCSAFKVLKSEVEESKPRNQNDVKKAKVLPAKSAGEVLKMDPEDLALLSLMTSGGLQLWDAKVFASVRTNATKWFTLTTDEFIGPDKLMRQAGSTAGLGHVFIGLSEQEFAQPHVQRAAAAVLREWKKSYVSPAPAPAGTPQQSSSPQRSSYPQFLPEAALEYFYGGYSKK